MFLAVSYFADISWGSTASFHPNAATFIILHLDRRQSPELCFLIFAVLNGYITLDNESFPRVKRPGRGADHPPSSKRRGHEKDRAIPLLTLCVSVA